MDSSGLERAVQVLAVGVRRQLGCPAPLLERLTDVRNAGRSSALSQRRVLGPPDRLRTFGSVSELAWHESAALHEGVLVGATHPRRRADELMIDQAAGRRLSYEPLIGG